MIGIPGLVFVALLVLKLIGQIDWSWWWITAPLWIGMAVWFVCIVILTILSILGEGRKR